MSKFKILLFAILILFNFNAYSETLVSSQNSPNVNSKKILNFANTVGIKIKQSLKNAKTKKQRHAVINYQQSNYKFVLNAENNADAQILVDCSAWVSNVLANTFPDLYKQMMLLSESGMQKYYKAKSKEDEIQDETDIDIEDTDNNATSTPQAESIDDQDFDDPENQDESISDPDLVKYGEEGIKGTLRAYVWFNIFNEILRSRNARPFADINAWVKTTTPEMMKEALKKNLFPDGGTYNPGQKSVLMSQKVKSYKKRYNYFQFMQTPEWKANLDAIANNWSVFKYVKNWRKGDIIAVLYKWNKFKIEHAIKESTGHVMLMVSDPKKIIKKKKTYYEFWVMDSAGGPKIDDKIRKKGDSGVGIGKIIVATDKDGYARGWKHIYKKWYDIDGKILAGRLRDNVVS
ncbi:MAG: hypothetical protein SZ59_C0006G0009 [candidate division TM6 bacterium GW2011_GWF2_28_16]|nr:MAG: hypothetical protein SZ59_C0006G0009 [candidate division TM6 bacterium GW2011_GWF2_28_16]